MIELSPNLIIPAVLFVLILMWILNRVLYRPLLSILDDRKTIVEGAARDAQKAEQGIDSLQRDYDQAMQEARRDAKRIYNQAYEAALASEKEILSNAQKRSGDAMEKAMADLEKSIDSAKEELASRAETLSYDICSKILGRSVQ